MSSKNTSQNSCLSLFENDKIVNNTDEVCNIFNSHFATCANSFGHSDRLSDSEDVKCIHESFQIILVYA